MGRKLPRGIAVSCSILLVLILLCAIIYFLSRQIAVLTETMPALKAKSVMIISEAEHWINRKFGITIHKQTQMINNALQDSESYVGQTVSTLLIGISVLVLIAVYVFFLLFYKPLILDFIFQTFSEKHSLRVVEILGETTGDIQSYIVGLLIEMVIVS